MKIQTLDANNVVSRSTKLLHMEDNPFNLGTLKVLDTFLSRINPFNENERTVSFTKKEYETLLGVSKIKTSSLCLYTDALQNTKVKLPLDGGGYDSIVLFDRCRVFNKGNEKVVELTCSASALDVFFNLEGIKYIKYCLSNVINLSSIYSVFLYYYLIENKYKLSWVTSLEELRKSLHVKENEYTDKRNFLRRIIKNSVEEVNAHTDIKVIYEPIREGRNITEIEFYITEYNEPKNIEFGLTYSKKEEKLIEETLELYKITFSNCVAPVLSDEIKKLIVECDKNGNHPFTLFRAVQTISEEVSENIYKLITLEILLKNAFKIMSLQINLIKDRLTLTKCAREFEKIIKGAE